MDRRHKADGCRTEHQGICQRNNSHTGGHPNMLNIIGRMGHQIPGFGFGKIGGRKGLYMRKKFIAQPFFNLPRHPDKAAPPYVTKNTDRQSNPNNIEGIYDQSLGIDPKGGQIVHGPFDDQGNQ